MNQNKLNNFISRFSLSKRISRILIDLNKINKNAQEIVAKKYDWENIGSQMNIVYDSLV